MNDEFPPSTRVEFTSDMSEDIAMMVSSLENNIVSGLILIVGVLLFFLGLANSGFVAIAIPSSMFLSFIIIKAMGMTMNMIVLFSLILALGMLVDNAIVVVENIYRYMEQGWDRVCAAKKATGEVALPVIGSTATTLAEFAPLIFWPGMVGEFMGNLPITLMITLTSSLFVALTIIPTLCSMFMKLDDERLRPFVARRPLDDDRRGWCHSHGDRAQEPAHCLVDGGHRWRASLVSGRRCCFVRRRTSSIVGSQRS